MTLERAILYLGLALQLAGIGAAAWGISDLRRSFSNQPSVLARMNVRLQQLYAWTRRALRRLFRRPGHTVVAVGAASAAAAAGSAEATLSLVEAKTTDPLSDRVDALEEQLRRVEKRLQSDLRNERKAREQAVTEEHSERAAADSELDTKIGRLATGGLRLESLGLLAILVGTLFATLPAGTAAVVRGSPPNLRPRSNPPLPVQYIDCGLRP